MSFAFCDDTIHVECFDLRDRNSHVAQRHAIAKSAAQDGYDAYAQQAFDFLFFLSEIVDTIIRVMFRCCRRRRSHTVLRGARVGRRRRIPYRSQFVLMCCFVTFCRLCEQQAVTGDVHRSRFFSEP